MPGLSFFDDLSALPREIQALVQRLIEEMRGEDDMTNEQPADRAVAAAHPAPVTDGTRHRLAG